MVEEKIGVVEHFFTNVSVAAVKITSGELKIGDTIHIVGAHTDIKQKIESMQIDRVPVETVKTGDDVGIKVKDRVREHDFVRIFFMQCSHCGKCCEETEMELSSRDIKRLEAVGYRREEFTVIDESSVTRLRNVGLWCYFYDDKNKRCRVYATRPLGCYLYPVVYSINEGVIVDDLCPMGETISEQEFRVKGEILLEVLKTIEEEI